MNSRNYLVGVIFVVLLIWGPINHSWPAWLAIRIGYLIAIPLVTWFILEWFWKLLKPDTATEDKLERALAAVTGGVLLIFSIIEAKADTHLGNTMWVRTPDGMDAVGEDITLSGPDWEIVIMLLAAAGVAFWISMAKREKPNSEWEDF